MEHLLTDMGLRIQELRKQMNLTQEALAEREEFAGYSHDVITMEVYKR